MLSALNIIWLSVGSQKGRQEGRNLHGGFSGERTSGFKRVREVYESHLRKLLGVEEEKNKGEEGQLTEGRG